MSNTTMPTPERPESDTVVKAALPEHTPGASERTGERYELLEEIARGGMGVVYRARDRVLDRDVGVKTFAVAPAADSDAARRFREEARITGQLQHPNVPPVHDLGTFPDGRPFLAMKLIRGRTLDAWLKERPKSDHDRGRFVAIFEQIAQGVAAAHAQGVIHRDLKPLNVMVGAFGEVQVMDWGLAKELGARDGAPGADDTRVTAPGGATTAGSVFGTPAYMPPEQARGETDRVDARSDVFSLGGVLCAILTGAPPYVGTGANDAHRLAVAAHLGDALARLDACGAEPELVALCKKCLAPEPADRPADAGEVARGVGDLRAEAERRARQAEQERAAAEARAAEHRKRARVQLALAAAVGLLLVGGGAFAWREDRRAAAEALRTSNEQVEIARRSALTEREVGAALAELNGLCDRGERELENPPRWRLGLTAARTAHNRAVAALGTGHPTDELRAAVRAAGERLARDEYDCETAELCERWFSAVFQIQANNPLERDFEELSTRTHTLLQRVGLSTDLSTEQSVARIRAQRMRYPITVVLTLSRAAFNENPAPQLRGIGKHLTAVVRELLQDNNPIVSRIADAIRARAETRAKGFLVSEEGARLTNHQLVFLFLSLDHFGKNDASGCVLDEAIRRAPNDAIPLFLRATTAPGYGFRFLSAAPPFREQNGRIIAACASAVALRPDLPELWSLYGSTLADEGLWLWAVECYQQALKLNPLRTSDHSSLGICLASLGRFEEAIATQRAALRRGEHLSPIGRNELRLQTALFALDLIGEQRIAQELLKDGNRRSGALVLEAKEPRKLLPTEVIDLRGAALNYLRDWAVSETAKSAQLGEVEAILVHIEAGAILHPIHLAAISPTESTDWVNLWATLTELRAKIKSEQRQKKDRPRL